MTIKITKYNRYITSIVFFIYLQMKWQSWLQTIESNLDNVDDINVTWKTLDDQISEIKSLILKLVNLDESEVFSTSKVRWTELAATARKIATILIYKHSTEDTEIISSKVWCSEARVKEMIRPWKKWWQFELSKTIDKVSNKIKKD